MHSRALRRLRTVVLFVLVMCLVMTGIVTIFVGLGDGSDVGVVLGVASLGAAVAVLSTMVVLADRSPVESARSHVMSVSRTEP